MADGAIANLLLSRMSAAITVWLAQSEDPEQLVLCYANERALMIPPRIVPGERLLDIMQCSHEPEVMLAGAPLVRGHVFDVARSGIGRAFSEQVIWRQERAYEAEILAVGPGIAALVLYDVTERERALQARKEDLRRTLYVLSHDMRKPARHMIGFGEAFIEDVAAGKSIAVATPMLDEMKAAGRRLERLLDGILQFAHLGHVDHWERIELAEAWKDAVVDYVMDLEGPAVEPSIDGLLPDVYGSRAMVTQLLSNLVANSVKFCRKPPVRVMLRAYPCSDVPNRVCLEVSDDGPGIPQAQWDEVFTLFRRGRESKGKPGMGLGLAVCRWIAEAHGGSIRLIESARGARFLIHLPACPATVHHAERT
jgi:signal transduction histidine kinase